jgi:WD40 repeat protein
MPDVLRHFHERIESALERKASPAKLSRNFLRTTTMLDKNESIGLQDKDGEMVLEAQSTGDNFKSNFSEFCIKNILEKSKRNKTNKNPKNKKKDIDYVFMILDSERLVKCCLIDGSIVKDYTSMLFDAKRPTDITAEIWEEIGPSGPRENGINDIAATSDHKWLFAACNAWWAILDLEQDKCVCRKHSTFSQDGQLPVFTSVAVSPDDQLFYIVTDGGTVKSYDIQAAKAVEVKIIPGQCFEKITVDPHNQFVFIANQCGNLFKYDTG